MDFNVSLRRAIKTGKVILGQNNTEKCLLNGKAQLVIIANNCPESFKQFISEKKDFPLHVFEGTSMQLGRACGKPFLVSAMAIIEPGDSDILNLKRI
jgi:large subunit ribosomal protein L30e